MTKDEAKTQERDALHAITHFSGLFNTGMYFYQINYWKRIWDRCHPGLFQSGSPDRQRSIDFTKKVLQYHHENTINLDERRAIKQHLDLLP